MAPDQGMTREELIEEIEILREELDKARLIEGVFRQTEKELRVKDKAISSSITPIVFLNMEAELTYVNAAFLSMWGYHSDGEVLGRPINEFFDASSDIDGVKAALETRGKWTGELKGREKNGGERSVQLSASVIKDNEGGSVCVMCSFVDISARKEFELKIVESKEFLSSLLNAIPEPVFVKDEKHKWIMLNDEACDMWGYSREEIIGKSDHDIFPKEQADVFWEKDDQVFRDGGTLVNEEKITRWDGEIRTISTVKTLCVDDVTGEKFLIGTIRDITDKKATESALQEQFHFLEQLIDIIPAPLFYKDVHGVYIDCNAAFCAFVGKEKKDIVGKDVFSLITHDLATLHDEKDKALLGNKGTQSYEARAMNPDGSRREMMYYKAAYTDRSGGVAGLVGVMMDVTEHRRSEEELRKSYGTTLEIIENAPFGIYLVNSRGDIDYVNPAMLEIEGDKYEDFTGMNVFRDRPEYGEIGLSAKLRSGLAGEYFEMKAVPYTSRHGNKATIRNFTGIPVGDGGERKLLMIVEDITERKLAEKELIDKKELLNAANVQLEHKVLELQNAMGHIKRLEGLVPICMNCKKMRIEGHDPKDQTAWIPLEKYISERTDASLTHGLCPECAKKLYGKTMRGKGREGP